MAKVFCQGIFHIITGKHTIGVIREVARRIYETEVIMKVQERKQEHVDTMITEHVSAVLLFNSC